MPQTLGAAGDAQLASGRYASAYLVDMHFAGGTLNLCTLPIPVQANGATYTGLGQFLQVDVVSVSEDGKADKINLSLGITNEAMLANVLGNVAGYRGRRVRIWLAAFSDSFVPQGAPALEWQGYMQPVQISRSLGAQGITGRIKMPCTRAGPGAQPQCPGPARHPRAAPGAVPGRPGLRVPGHADGAAHHLADQALPGGGRMSRGIAVLLGEYLAVAQGRRFNWADANCCHFAAAWVEVATGRNPMHGLPRTDNARQALRLVQALGGDLVAAWTHRLGWQPVAPALAQVGDLVLLPMPADMSIEPCTGTAMGICAGMCAVVATSDGCHAYLPMGSATAAWRLQGGA